MLLDARGLSTQQVQQFASRIQASPDFELPKLKFFNDLPCVDHEVLTAGCRSCGIRFRRHQRVAIPWLYLRKRALLADAVGTGKTVIGAGLLAYLAETGEVSPQGRAIICVRAPALMQWHAELRRMLPDIPVEVARGTKNQRVDRYVNPWYALLISPQTLINDYEMLLHFRLNTLMIDDVDALRNRETTTAYVLKRIGQFTDRFVFMSGTPLQKRLMDLWSVLEPMGGREVFGDDRAMERRYVRMEKVTLYNYGTGRKKTAYKQVGTKNIAEFSRLLQPFALRRTAADIDDVDLPAVIPNNIFLELYPAQKAKYDELRKGVVTLMRDGARQVKRANAMSKVLYGQQICTGLATLGEEDAPNTSVKLDWIMDKVSDGGDLEDEKIVVFAAFKNTIRALQTRLSRAGIGYVTVWGEEPDKSTRFQAQKQFWEDPTCKLLLGTQAIEQSLNLQIARHLVNIDQILNPSRMEQLAGRIRRDGSAFKSVYVHNLLTVDTQEERVLPLLQREQAVIDAVWSERSEIFPELSPLQLLELITR